MRAIKYRELKRLHDNQGPRFMVKHLTEALKTGQLAPEDFSLNELYEACMGSEALRRLDPRKDDMILEFGGISGVDSTAFSNITGQLAISKVLEGYASPDFALTRMIGTVSTRIKDTEIIPGLQGMGDVSEVVHEQELYPHVGFGENYITTPRKVKRGCICAVTKEAIFFDLTGQMLSNANKMGYTLGLNREIRVADLILGVTNNYNWLGNALNTYYDATTSATAAAATGLNIWINIHRNPLVDWTDVDHAEQLFARMRDPFTNMPIIITGKTLLVMPQLRHSTRMIINSTEVRRDNTNQRTLAANPLDPYPIVASEFLYMRALAAGWTTPENCWWLGDFKRAFSLIQNWDITTSQAPSNSEAEFNQDIVARFKASVREVEAVMEPRAVVRSCASYDLSSSSGEIPR